MVRIHSTHLAACLLVVAALAVAGCASTELVSQWKSPAFSGPPLKKVMVVGVSSHCESIDACSRVDSHEPYPSVAVTVMKRLQPRKVLLRHRAVCPKEDEDSGLRTFAANLR